MEEESIQQFFENFTGEKSLDFFQLQKSGSERANFVGVDSKQKYIITHNQNVLENEAFFYFSNVFSELELNTPKILAINADENLYIQEYLGAETLFEILEAEGECFRTKSLVKKVVEQLFYFQKKTQNKIDYKNCFEYETFDEIPILHDLYYFKNYFLDVLEIHYHKSSLLKEFKQLTSEIENLKPRGLMLRDFQSRNIMVNDNEIYFIDYQSAMEGPLAYDLVSFLHQAKANFSTSFKEEMFGYYLRFYDDLETKKQLEKSYEYSQIIRFMQVLGAYGFRGIIQKKPHFLESIENGINNLYHFSEKWNYMSRYPILKEVIEKICSLEIQEKIKNLTHTSHVTN